MEVICLLLIMSGTLLSEASLTVRHEYIDRSGASISSPNFPKYYNDNEESTYHVVAPTGSVVVLYFNYFDIEGNPYGECHDFLEVKHWDASTTFTRKLCGFSLPSPIYSLGNVMNLTFQTDSVTTLSGFHLYVYFTKSTNPYFPMDGVNDSLRILMAVNVTIGIVIVSFVVLCFVLNKRKSLQIKSSVRSQEEEYLSILDGEPTNPGTVPLNIKGRLHDALREKLPSPENSQKGYLEMKSSFKKKEMKHEKHKREPIDTPEGEYARPSTDELQKVAQKRNTVEYSVPSDIELIDTNKYEITTTIPKPEYRNIVTENDENNTTRDTQEEITPSTEDSECYLDMKAGFKKTIRPGQHSVKPIISTYGDTESADTPEIIYASPIIEQLPEFLEEKKHTVEYSEPCDVNMTGSNICHTNSATPKSEYSTAIIESNEHN